MSNFPSFYDPNRIGTLFHPDVAAIAVDAAATGLAPASSDTQSVHLVIIDMQTDFCHPDGTLYVPGAPDDIRRLIEFIYRHAAHITNITCSLDSHLPHQIFSPGWWVDAQGKHPDPFTLISYADIKAGKWRALIAPIWSVEYVKRLEQGAKKTLTIWPYHTMIGNIGHALDQELWSAVFWHAMARKTQPTWLTKGSVPQTEHYSIVQPEVLVPQHPMGGVNKAFLDTLDEADIVLVAGEAESHCVLESVADIVEGFGNRPDALSKIFFLSDCTSPVLHPDVDFHAIAQAEFTQFAGRGVNFVASTDKLPFLQGAVTKSN